MCLESPSFSDRAEHQFKKTVLKPFHVEVLGRAVKDLTRFSKGIFAFEFFSNPTFFTFIISNWIARTLRQLKSDKIVNYVSLIAFHQKAALQGHNNQLDGHNVENAAAPLNLE